MLTVGGQPVLERNVELLQSAGVRDIFINLHHCPESIQSHFGDGSRFGVSIRYRFEPQLLGTAGAVRNFACDLLPQPYFVIYGDNYSGFDLNELWEGHRRHRAAIGSRSLVTVGLYERPDVLQSGIADLDSRGRIIRFLEKPRPDEVFSHLVNAGCYVLEPAVHEWIPAQGPSDFGRDIFPRLASEQRLFGVKLAGWLRPIDTEPLWQHAQNWTTQEENT